MSAPESEDDEPDVMTAMLGPKPPTNTQEVEDFIPRIAERGGPVVVLNDEAHHTHDEDSEWNKAIRRVARRSSRRFGRATGFHRHATAHQGATVFLDGVRLPA